MVAGAVFCCVHLAQTGWCVDLEKLLQDVSDTLGDWTYLLAGLLAFLETGAFVGLVVPGETFVILAGAVAGQGATDIYITIAIVWFSAWAGDTTSFFIGRRLGRGFILRHGPKLRITEERFEQVEGYFKRHGGKTILIGRFIGLVRALAPFVAGSSGMEYRAFVPYSVLGTGLWAGTFSVLGYVGSRSIERIADVAGQGVFLFGVTVAVVVVIVAAVRFLREPENRRKAVEWMDRRALLRPLVAAGAVGEAGGAVPVEPDHAGEPGPGADRDAGGALGRGLHRRRVREHRVRGSRPDPWRQRGHRRRGEQHERLAHGSRQGGDRAGLGGRDAAVGLSLPACWPFGAGGPSWPCSWSRCALYIAVPVMKEAIDRPAPRAGWWTSGVAIPERARRLCGALRVDGADGGGAVAPGTGDGTALIVAGVVVVPR